MKGKKCKHKKTEIEKTTVFNDGHQFLITNLWKGPISKGHITTKVVCIKCGKTLSKQKEKMRGFA